MLVSDMLFVATWQCVLVKFFTAGGFSKGALEQMSPDLAAAVTKRLNQVQDLVKDLPQSIAG